MTPERETEIRAIWDQWKGCMPGSVQPGEAITLYLKLPLPVLSLGNAPAPLRSVPTATFYFKWDMAYRPPDRLLHHRWSATCDGITVEERIESREHALKRGQYQPWEK